MKKIIQEHLLSHARAYLDSCERDYEASQKRLDVARRIFEHVKGGGGAAGCPCPMLNETEAQASRFAARVDAILLALYDDERKGES